jgi:ABC-2 type transport system permease protein
MEAVVKVNPISYAVDPLRRLVLEAQDLPVTVMDRLGEFGLGLSVGGHQMTILEDLGVIVAFGLVMNLLAMWLVSLQD